MHPECSAADLEADISAQMTCTNLPQVFVAISDSEVIGAAELKLHEVKALPDFEYWVGGVYVSRLHRGEGVASDLTRHVMSKARTEYGVSSLYLQTEQEDGGLYKKLGWCEVTRIKYNERIRIVMAKEL